MKMQMNARVSLPTFVVMVWVGGDWRRCTEGTGGLVQRFAISQHHNVFREESEKKRELV